jgi:hypothetical protein
MQIGGFSEDMMKRLKAGGSQKAGAKSQQPPQPPVQPGNPIKPPADLKFLQNLGGQDKGM